MMKTMILLASLVSPDTQDLPPVIDARMLDAERVILFHDASYTIARAEDVTVELGVTMLRPGSSFATASIAPGKYETEWKSDFPIPGNKTKLVTHRVVTDCSKYRTRELCAKAHILNVRNLMSVTSITTVAKK